jgi:hypothetical protein
MSNLAAFATERLEDITNIAYRLMVMNILSVKKSKMRRNKMINIRELRIGDIITKENKYEGYKYSIVEGIDNISGTIRHKEVYEDGGGQMAISSCEDMSPFPLSEAILKAHGWDYVYGGPLMSRLFDDKLIGIRKSVDGDGFYPIVFSGCFVDMKVGMVLNCIHGVHELQALLDALGCRLSVKPLIMEQ